MVSLASGSDLALDMYETGLASALSPIVTLATNNQLRLDFSSGFSDVLEGHDFGLDVAGDMSTGIITAIREYRYGTLVFHADGLTLPATTLVEWLGTGDYQSIFGAVMAGDDIVTASMFSDRIFTMSGDDVVESGAGDDMIEGGAGNDILNGGSGDDYLDGGEGSDRLIGGLGSNVLDGGDGWDTAFYDGFRKNYTVGTDVDGMRVQGAGAFDVLSGIESISFKDGRLIFDTDAIGAQIIRLYDAVLGRAPDNVGLDFYLDRIEDYGGSLLGVANELIASTEFQLKTDKMSNSQFVDYVYMHTLERAPDAAGKTYYIQQLDGELSRGNFVIQLSESAENHALTADLVSQGYFDTDDAYQSVALLYDGFAGRLPDGSGLAYYAERVKAKTMTLAQVANDFAGSAEFHAATAGRDNGQLVDYIYQNTLQRVADVGGRAFYKDQLDHGATAASVLQDLALSAEHYTIYAVHITYGIDVL